MKKHVFRSLSLLIALMLMVMSCGKVTPPPPSSPSSENSDPLVFYVDFYNKDYLPDIIDSFKTDHPEIEVRVEDYSSLTPEAYHEKLAGDLMAGQGPDIILSNYTSYGISNLTKLIQNGKLLDLNSLRLDLSACNTSVLKAGEYGGGQYLLPLNYGVGFLLTSVERIATYGIAANGTLDEFASSLAAAYSSDKIVFPQYFTTNILYPQSGISLIDYKTKEFKSDHQSQSLIKDMTAGFDKLFPDIFNDAARYTYHRQFKNYNYEVINAFLADDALFLSENAFMGAHENIRTINSWCDKIMQAGETPYLFVLPSASGNTAPFIHEYFCVNTATKNSEAVKLFLEHAIQPEQQYDFFSHRGIPVNTQSVEDMYRFYCEDASESEFKYPEFCTFPAQITTRYFDTLSSLSEGIFYDANINNALMSIVREQIMNGKSFKEAYAIGNDQIKLYLSE